MKDSRWRLSGSRNVGKSSLFNRLLEQDRAIVTDIPGTTRDLVSETASVEGIPVKFVDTAGIREGQDTVESLGIERSYQAMADADLTLVVIDASAVVETADEDFDRVARREKFWWSRINAIWLRRSRGLGVSALTGRRDRGTAARHCRRDRAAWADRTRGRVHY